MIALLAAALLAAGSRDGVPPGTDPAYATTARGGGAPDGDEAVIRDLDLLQNLELLENLELFLPPKEPEGSGQP